MMRLMRTLFYTLLVLGVSSVGFFSGFEFSGKTHEFLVTSAYGAPKPKDSKDRKNRYENLELFQKVLHFIETNYVDDVKNDDLVYGAIKGMMDTLDPHSAFLGPEIFKDMKVDTSGKFGGLGIEIGMKDDILTVVTPMEETPAWRAGLKAGDRIVKIMGKSTKGMNLEEAVSLMRGKKGTSVLLSIYRRGAKSLKDYNIKREEIRISPVKFEELEPGYGYIRLRNFNENATRDMEAAMAKMDKSKKLQGLVFDMRGTPGGLLDQAVEVSSLFIDEGVVVSTVGRNRDQKEVKHARPGKARKDLPVVILVNSSTASAAEIVAGALQDHHRAVVMGQPTFGKGSVQTVIELGPDIGMKLTIARYYTPNGRSIQEKGVAPDILLDEYDDKLLAKAKVEGPSFREKDLEGHLVNDQKEGEYSVEELEAVGQKKSHAADEEDSKPVRFEPKEDFQVKEALNYLKSYEIFKKLERPGDSA